LAEAIAARLGVTSLAFYDAISRRSFPPTPWNTAGCQGVRRQGGGDDYWNAPLTQPEYEAFVAALIAGDRISQATSSTGTVFRGLSAGREMAQRGLETLRFAR